MIANQSIQLYFCGVKKELVQCKQMYPRCLAQVRKLGRNLGPWLNRKRVVTDYFLDKALTPNCVFCNGVADDTDKKPFFIIEGEMGFVTKIYPCSGKYCQIDAGEC